MLRLMTPIDALSYGIKAGMVLGQAQTLWATRLMEMQGFWMGFSPMVPDMPTAPAAADPEDGPLMVLAPVTELHVEAMAAEPPVTEPALAEPPVAEVISLAPVEAPVAEPPVEEVTVAAEVPVADPAPVAEAATVAAPVKARRPRAPKAAPVPFAAAASGEMPAPVAEAPGPELDAPLPVEVAPEPPAAPPEGLELKPIPRRAARREKRASKTPSAE